MYQVRAVSPVIKYPNLGTQLAVCRGLVRTEFEGTTSERLPRVLSLRLRYLSVLPKMYTTSRWGRQHKSRHSLYATNVRSVSFVPLPRTYLIQRPSRAVALIAAAPQPEPMTPSADRILRPLCGSFSNRNDWDKRQSVARRPLDL